MPVNCTILYESAPDAIFDMSYYLKTHMPLVAEKWGPYGLTGWSVLQFADGPDGSKPQYSVQATLTWENGEQVAKALGGKETEEVMEDVKNFSNKGPIFLVGNVVGSS